MELNGHIFFMQRIHIHDWMNHFSYESNVVSLTIAHYISPCTDVTYVVPEWLAYSNELWLMQKIKQPNEAQFRDI